jgi:kynurenine formamidase
VVDKQASEVSAAEFDALFREVCAWNRWDASPERGALNYLTAERIRAAAGLVRSGVTVTLSRWLPTEDRADNPTPAEHHMTMLTDVDIGSGSVRFTKDYIGADYHNDGHSHIDAFCHVAYRGRLYGGAPETAVTAAGADVDGIDVLEHGLIGRGVLLDIPQVRGVRWLEPGEHVYPDDLAAAERAQGVEVGSGDILLVRTGHARRLAELGPWDTRDARAGLHPTAARFVAERRVAALGSDGNNDTGPSTTEGVGFPIHVLALNAMGVHLLDWLQFEDLLVHCEAMARWDFLLVAAPLRVAHATGSPVNPIAVL